MEELVLGYQGQSLTEIFTELLVLLRNTSAEDTIAGDVKLASRMVLNGVTSAVDIPDILTYAKEDLPPEVGFFFVSPSFCLLLLMVVVGLVLLAGTSVWVACSNSG